MRFRRTAAMFIAIGLLLSSTFAWSQTSAVPPEHKRAMMAAADYVSVASGLTDRLLTSYGYTPPAAAAEWRRAAPIRKLTLAYLAATRADAQHGGDRFLALLAQDLAQRYDIRQGPLVKYASQPRHSVTFRHLDALPAKIDLPPPIRFAVSAAASYCTYGIDPAKILVHDLGIATDEEAQDLLVRSKTIEDAFQEALSKHDSAEQRKRVTAVASRLDERYGTVSYDRHLAPFLPNGGMTGSTSPGDFEPPSPRTRPPGGGGGGGGGFPHARPPASTRNAEAAFSEARSTWARRSVPTSFARAAVIVGGAGGILFGNSVRDAGLPAVTLLAYVPRAADNGDIVVTFGDGSHALFPYVTLEEASAAKAIVFNRVGTLKNDPADAAIPLVSMRRNLDYRECDASKKAAYGSLFDMIVHPALARSDLGWSAIVVDMYPTIAREIHDQRKKMGKPATPLLPFVRDLRAHHAFNWKVVDVPVLVERSGERLTLQRDAKDAEFPEGLRRAAFLEMRPFYEASIMSDEDDDAKPDMEFARDFYAQLPAVMRQVREYRDLNSFAQVVALFRWAKAKGAKFQGTVTAPNSVRAPEAVAVVRGSLKLVTPPSDGRSFVDRCPDERAR